MPDINFAVVASRLAETIQQHYQDLKNFHNSTHESLMAEQREDPFGFYSNGLGRTITKMIGVEKELEHIELIFTGVTEGCINIPRGEEEKWINSVQERLQENLNNYAMHTGYQGSTPMQAIENSERVKAWAIINKAFNDAYKSALAQ